MQKEEKDSPITDNKKLLRVLNLFDGAGLLTLRRLSSEELDLLCDFITQHQLGARSVVPATRPQSNNLKKEQEQQ